MAKNLQTHTCLEGCIHRNQAHFLQTFCDVYVQICVQSDIYGLKILRTEGVSKQIDGLKLSHENVKVVHYNKRQYNRKEPYCY